MDLTWLGHAAFRLRTGSTNVFMDPYPESMGFKIPVPSEAHLVTMSNSSPKHSAIEAVTKANVRPAALRGPGEYEIFTIYVKGVRTAAPSSGDELQWNTVFTLQAEGLTVCHLGNPGQRPGPKELEEIGSPDVLLLPIGSTDGLSAEQAAELANSISPRIIVPMLYTIPGESGELRGLAPFLQELGAKEPDNQPRLSVTRTSLPAEMQLVILQPAGQRT